MGFDELFGNEPIKKSLINAIHTGHIANAYVFEGMAGTGKRLCASLFARALVCNAIDSSKKPCNSCSACTKALSGNHPDIVYCHPTDGKASIGVEDIREQILSAVYLKPYLAERRVFLIGQGDLLSVEAQNALLKVLEEPPENVTFIICVTKQDKLLSTVLSRSFVLSFFPLSTKEVFTYLENKFGANDKNLLSAALSQGSIGAAISFLNDENTEKLFNKTIDQCILLGKDVAKVRDVANFLIEEKENIELVTDFMITFLRDCVFVKSGLEKNVIYANKLSLMRVFTANLDKPSLVSAFDRLTDLRLRIKQNLNYSASVLETVMCIWEDFHDKSSGHSI